MEDLIIWVEEKWKQTLKKKKIRKERSDKFSNKGISTCTSYGLTYKDEMLEGKTSLSANYEIFPMKIKNKRLRDTKWQKQNIWMEQNMENRISDTQIWDSSQKMWTETNLDIWTRKSYNNKTKRTIWEWRYRITSFQRNI